MILQLNGIGGAKRNDATNQKLALITGGMAELQFEEEDDDAVAQTQELPPHACKYCGIHDPGTVVMCNICKVRENKTNLKAFI